MDIYKLKYDLNGLSDKAVQSIINQVKKLSVRVVIKRDGKKIYDTKN
jgi:hypothetical protein